MSHDSTASSARRTFLKAGTGIALAGFPAILKGQGAPPIKFGLVGCGGRGTGAAGQALRADDNSVLHAVADVYQSAVDGCLQRLKRVAEPRVQVAPDRQFVGLDAYQKLIDSGVDVVLLATPPGFRPQHLRTAINAGKHVFCEKPVATDPVGVRHVLETAALARQKNVSLVSGFCWRYSTWAGEPMKRVHDGAIGDILAYYATYYTGPVKPMPPASQRPAGMSDVEWQISNWYNFNYLSGDGLVEQAIHSVDKVCWAWRDVDPVSCVAVGGRQSPAHGGNIFDHFETNYLYPNGVRAFVVHRQIPRCYNENSDYVLGTKGQLTITGRSVRITGQNEWTFTEQRNDMYQAEHDALFASIRKGQPINDGNWMAHSTMVGIMGRMAAYTGQEVTWEQVMKSQEKLVPDSLDWNGTFTPAPMAIPGETKLV